MPGKGRDGNAEFIFQAICRIGIFMICVRAVIYFRPNESYEKYLRLLAGILIMIQLFLPVGRLLLGRGGQEAAQVLQQFRRELGKGGWRRLRKALPRPMLFWSR